VGATRGASLPSVEMGENNAPPTGCVDKGWDFRFQEKYARSRAGEKTPKRGNTKRIHQFLRLFSVALNNREPPSARMVAGTRVGVGDDGRTVIFERTSAQIGEAVGELLPTSTSPMVPRPQFPRPTGTGPRDEIEEYDQRLRMGILRRD